MDKRSLLDIPEGWDASEEFFETLLDAGGIRIERIISKGHVTPAGKWYDQDTGEWVGVIQGEARLLFDNHKQLDLRAGDWLHIPAHRRHRVERTSAEPPCVWLAVHFG